MQSASTFTSLKDARFLLRADLIDRLVIQLKLIVTIRQHIG